MKYKNRRQHHGLVLEPLVLEELIEDGIIEPIQTWPSMMTYMDGQKYFESATDTSEESLDEVAYIYDSNELNKISVIIEIKCMRFMNWNAFRDHGQLHREVAEQHFRHLNIAKENSLDGVTIIGVNKDSSEYHLRTYSSHDSNLLSGFSYDY